MSIYSLSLILCFLGDFKKDSKIFSLNIKSSLHFKIPSLISKISERYLNDNTNFLNK